MRILLCAGITCGYTRRTVNLHVELVSDVLCASIIDGDKRILCNAQQRKSIDDYKLRCDDFEEALTAIEHVYRNLEPA
jgi:hypothetical protein